MRNTKGQVVVETVLLMVFTVGLFFFTMNILKEKKVLANLISGPWAKTAGMIESGSWDPPKEAAKNHPNKINRNLSLDPDKI